MSLAWSTVSLLVFLSPGIFFIFGLFSNERVSRETSSASATSHLAAIVVVSFFINGCVFVAVNRVIPFGPDVDLYTVFAGFQLSQAQHTDLDEFATNIERNACWIMTWCLTTFALGFLLGRSTGRLVQSGALKILSKHAWVYGLITADDRQRSRWRRFLEWLPFPFSFLDNITRAAVLTTTRHENRMLLYSGELSSIYFRQDGTLAYLRLERWERHHIEFDDEDWDPTDQEQPSDWLDMWHEGSGAQTVPPDFMGPEAFGEEEGGFAVEKIALEERQAHRHASESLVIEGDQIVNISFDDPMLLQSTRSQREYVLTVDWAEFFVDGDDNDLSASSGS